MDDTTILGQLGQTAKKVGEQIVKIPEEGLKDAGEQIGFNRTKNPDQQVNLQQKQWQSDEERIKFLKDLYGKSDMSKDRADASKNLNKEAKKPSEFQEQIANKPPEEQKKLMELRQQLHKENYYDPTFNPPKNSPAGGEERPAEKIEQEKKQEMQDLQQKDAKKPPPLAVVREQNKAEMFRGVAG